MVYDVTKYQICCLIINFIVMFHSKHRLYRDVYRIVIEMAPIS